jgi:hypothetical protein
MAADNLSLLKQDVTRVLSIYLIPGFVATWPFMQTLQEKFPFIGYYLRNNSEVLILTYILVSYTVGLILEDLASNIEYYYADKMAIRDLAKKELESLKITDKDQKLAKRKELIEKHEKIFYETWDKFMKIIYTDATTPNGHRVLRNIVLRLKFELSMGLAIILFLIGLTFLNNYINFVIHWYYVLGCIVLSAFLLLYESQNSSKVLHDLRTQLVTP